MVVAPTCPTCLRGVSDVNDGVVKKVESDSVRIYVVWVPMFRGRESDVPRATTEVLDARASHYWDGTSQLVAGFRETLALNEPGVGYLSAVRAGDPLGRRPTAGAGILDAPVGFATESTREGPVPRRRFVPGPEPAPSSTAIPGSAETLGHSRHREPLPGGATAHHRAADAPPPTLRRGSVSRPLSQRRPEPLRPVARVRGRDLERRRRPSTALVRRHAPSRRSSLSASTMAARCGTGSTCPLKTSATRHSRDAARPAVREFVTRRADAVRRAALPGCPRRCQHRLRRVIVRRGRGAVHGADQSRARSGGC